MTNLIQCSDRAEWLAARRKLIGASDSAAILGLGYAEQNAWTVWDEKVNPPQEEDDEQAEALEVGRLLEPGLRKVFAWKTGFAPLATDPHTILQHPDIPWLGCTLDAKALNPAFGIVPVELKNVGLWMAAEWSDGETPLKFQIQCQHQMLVTGAPACGIMGLVAGNRVEVRWLERNERFIAGLLKHLEAFWECVQAKQTPKVDHTFATAKVINKLFPKDSGLAVWLPDDADLWLAKRRDGKEREKVAQRDICEADNHLKLMLGDATYGETPAGDVISWKHQFRSGYSVPDGECRVLCEVKKLPPGTEFIDPATITHEQKKLEE